MGLRIQNLTKRYGAREVVRAVSLEAADGEFVVLLGPSGCGKTTLLRIIAGLEEPDEGAVLLGAQDITHLEPRRRDVAMVFQSYALYPHMTVAENIGYPLRVRRQNRPEIASEVERIATRLGLAHLLANRPRQLSGGERQRVALARAIIRRPQAFLMDEPLSNLDARLRLDMRGELKHLQHELGIVTLYVTHDQAEAMTLAHRIAVLKDGCVQQFDTPAQIYHRPANLFVAGFLGSPSMNLLAGSIESGTFHCAGLQVDLPAASARHDVTLGIRPEDIEFSPCSQPSFTSARVWVTEEMGNETLIRLRVDDLQITLRAPAAEHPGFDTPAWFRIRPDKVHLFDSHTTEAIR
jgi:multiple sugar transport system ATP-binding protein